MAASHNQICVKNILPSQNVVGQNSNHNLNASTWITNRNTHHAIMLRKLEANKDDEAPYFRSYLDFFTAFPAKVEDSSRKQATLHLIEQVGKFDLGEDPCDRLEKAAGAEAQLWKSGFR